MKKPSLLNLFKDPFTKKDVLFLFKSFSRDQYSNEVQKILAYPVNSYYTYEASSPLISQEFISNNFKKLKNNTEVFILCVFYPDKQSIDIEVLNNNFTEFLSYVPLRYGKLKIEKGNKEWRSARIKIQLKEYPEIKKDIPSITKLLRDRFNDFPKYYKCGINKDKTDFKLISYHSNISLKELYEIVGNKSKSLDAASLIIETINSVDTKDSQNIYAKYYFFPIIRLLNERRAPLKNKGESFRYNKNGINLELNYSIVPKFIESLKDDERKLNIYLFNTDVKNELIDTVPILRDTSTIQSQTIKLEKKYLDNFDNIQIHSSPLKTDKLNAPIFKDYRSDEINVFGEYLFPVKINILYSVKNYFKDLFERLLRAIPIAALLFREDLISLMNNSEKTFNICVVVVLVLGYVIIPQKKFLGDMFKEFVKKVD